MIIMAIPVVIVAQASRSYISRMLRNRVLVRFVAVYLCTVAAHAQNATWSTSPGSGDWKLGAGYGADGNRDIRFVDYDDHHVLEWHLDRHPPVQRRSASLYL